MMFAFECFEASPVSGKSKFGTNWYGTAVNGVLHGPDGKQAVSTILFHDEDKAPKFLPKRLFTPVLSLRVNRKGNIEAFVSEWVAKS